MAIAQSLLPEFDVEMANTRKTLERVPDSKFDWQPHQKSGSMGWLAGHLANLPLWAAVTLQQDSLDLEPPGRQRLKARDRVPRGSRTDKRQPAGQDVGTGYRARFSHSLPAASLTATMRRGRTIVI